MTLDMDMIRAAEVSSDSDDAPRTGTESSPYICSFYPAMCEPIFPGHSYKCVIEGGPESGVVQESYADGSLCYPDSGGGGGGGGGDGDLVDPDPEPDPGPQ
mgnify:CR=1 FL=1